MKIVMVREGKMLKSVQFVKERVELLKCSRWDLECISKYNKIVTSAMDKDKSLEREENVKVAKVKKSFKNKKYYKLQLIKESQIITQLSYLEREMKFLMHWQVI